MIKIGSSVGNNATNNENDVLTIQSLLNKCIHRLSPIRRLKADGDCGPLTVGVIIEFQRRIMNFKTPDGRIDPGGKSLDKMNELAAENGQGSAIKQQLVDQLLVRVQAIVDPLIDLYNMLFTKSKPGKKLTSADFQTAASALGAEVAAIKAVASVESAGGGFLTDNRPKILFEGHWFSKFTGGKYDKTHPSISYKKWTKTHYVGGPGEYNRLTQAERLDKESAWKSTSWGKFQIMGFNYKHAGYHTVEAFVKDMRESEGKQLLAFVKFLKSKKLDVHLKAKNWAKFAAGYNGPSYAKNQYDVRLQQAYKAFSAAKK